VNARIDRQVISLPRFLRRLTLQMMAVQRSSVAILGVVLALAAVLGPVQVAMVDTHSDDDHDHAVMIDHDDQAPAKQADGDGPAHLLAHAAGHWVAFDGARAAPVAAIVAARVWSILTPSLPSGIDPSKLLRPPRG
jgi:hypothetical protein